ncbi:hypothetical protein [Saccharopolyspora sp. NPDC002578]
MTAIMADPGASAQRSADLRRGKAAERPSARFGIRSSIVLNSALIFVETAPLPRYPKWQLSRKRNDRENRGEINR